MLNELDKHSEELILRGIFEIKSSPIFTIIVYPFVLTITPCILSGMVVH